MTLEYVVIKHMLSSDKDKNEKYVAKSVHSGRVNFAKTCRKVSQLCGIRRKVVDLVVSGLVDKMAKDIDDGKNAQLGEFSIFSPTVRAESVGDEKDISSESVVQRKITSCPGKTSKGMLEGMSITRRVGIETDYTDGSSSGGSSGDNPDSGDDSKEKNGEAPDPAAQFSWFYLKGVFRVVAMYRELTYDR